MSVQEVLDKNGIDSSDHMKVYEQIMTFCTSADPKFKQFTLSGSMKKMNRRIIYNTLSQDESEKVNQYDGYSEPALTNTSSNAAINEADIKNFVRNGYLKCEGLVNSDEIDACNYVINHHLGLPGAVAPGGAQEGLGKLQGSLSQHLAGV